MHATRQHDPQHFPTTHTGSASFYTSNPHGCTQSASKVHPDESGRAVPNPPWPAAASDRSLEPDVRLDGRCTHHQIHPGSRVGGGTSLEVIWLSPSSPGSPGLCWENSLALSKLGDAMPDDNAHAADDARKLRARFPRWGILFDPLESVWVAVRGKRTLVAASSPEKLTEQVEAAARGEAGLDEGDKTQTWRALRKHRRG
jgi:hypothetical protein